MLFTFFALFSVLANAPRNALKAAKKFLKGFPSQAGFPFSRFGRLFFAPCFSRGENRNFSREPSALQRGFPIETSVTLLHRDIRSFPALLWSASMAEASATISANRMSH